MRMYIYIYYSDTEIKHARMWIKASKTLCALHRALIEP